MQVCYPTTPAQYFHMLRRQVKQEEISPLIVMTPKSLLRLPAATSAVEDLTSGGFMPVIGDQTVKDDSAITRVVICSGKVYYDLDDVRTKESVDTVAIIRLEQFYPFPETGLSAIFDRYPNANEIVWAQEEPKNMGGWSFVEPRIEQIIPESSRFIYVGRDASPSPATGSYTIHGLEQKRIVDEALGRSD